MLEAYSPNRLAFGYGYTSPSVCLHCHAKPTANSFGTSPCYIGSAHHSVMPSLASTNSFSRTSFVKQCPYRNPRHTTFGCRPAFSHFAPCDRAIRRPKLALPSKTVTISSTHCGPNYPSGKAASSAHAACRTQVCTDSTSPPRFRHDRFVAEGLRLYHPHGCVLSFTERISDCQRANPRFAVSPAQLGASVLRGCSCHIRRTERQWRSMQTDRSHPTAEAEFAGILP